jgi:hypothetical protein
MQALPLTARLALLGALPFVISSLLLALDINSLPLLGSVANLLSSYTLVIAVFMCGVHWGQYLQQPEEHSLNLLLISNILTVLLWFIWLLSPLHIFLAVALTVFVILLMIDMRLRLLNVISKSYFRTRMLVTGIVCLFLILAIYSL